MKLTHFILATLLLHWSQTWAASPPQAEGETLAAQVSVTRDLLNRVLVQLQNNSHNVGEGQAHPDFIAKSREFNARVEKVMQEFETKLANGPLKLAAVWVDRIKGVSSSHAYTQEQKSALTRDLYSQAQKHFEVLSVEYQNLLRDLYALVLPKASMELVGVSLDRPLCNGIQLDRIGWYGADIAPRCTREIQARYRLTSQDPVLLGIQTEFVLGYEGLRANNLLQYSVGSYKTEQEVREIAVQLNQLYKLEAKWVPQLGSAIYERVIQPGCFSTTCMPLFASQLLSYISLVKSTLDKDIAFPVGGVGTLLLGKLDFPSKQEDFLSTERALQLGLPFEIREGEYRAAITKQLKDLLVSRDQDYPNAGCTTATAYLGRVTCFSEQKCLNESERSMISSAIEGSNLGRSERARRQACLKTMTQ